MPDSPTILVLNGPNLNMLGIREPEIYGQETLADIETTCREHAGGRGYNIDFRQSNSEGELVGWIQEGRGKVAGVAINAAAYTLVVALLDALTLLDVPTSKCTSQRIRTRNIPAPLYISSVATGVICGFGSTSYILGLDAIIAIRKRTKTNQMTN